MLRSMGLEHEATRLMAGADAEEDVWGEGNGWENTALGGTLLGREAQLQLMVSRVVEGALGTDQFLFSLKQLFAGRGPMSVEDYTEAMAALARIEGASSIQRALLADLTKSAVFPSAQIYSHLVVGACQDNDVEHAEDYYRRHLSTREKCASMRETIAALVRMYLRLDSVDKAADNMSHALQHLTLQPGSDDDLGGMRDTVNMMVLLCLESPRLGSAAALLLLERLQHASGRDVLVRTGIASQISLSLQNDIQRRLASQEEGSADLFIRLNALNICKTPEKLAVLAVLRLLEEGRKREVTELLVGGALGLEGCAEVLQALYWRKRVQEAACFTAAMEETGLHLDSKMFNVVLRCTAALSDPKKFETTLADMSARGVEGDADTLHACIIHRLAHDWDASTALHLLDEKAAQGVEPHLKTVELLARAMLERNDYAGAAQILLSRIDSSPSLRHCAYNILVAMASSQGDLQGLFVALRKMQASGCAADDATYQTMTKGLSSYLVGNSAASPGALLQKLKLIVVRESQSGGFKADVPFYFSMLSLAGEEQDFLLWVLHSLMASDSYYPQQLLHPQLLRAIRRISSLPGQEGTGGERMMRTVLKELASVDMQHAKIPQVSQMQLIVSLCATGLVDEALYFFENWGGAHVHLSSAVQEAIIRALARQLSLTKGFDQQQPIKARLARVLSGLVAAEDSSSRSLQHYNLLLKAHGECGDQSAVRSLVK